MTDKLILHNYFMFTKALYHGDAITTKHEYNNDNNITVAFVFIFQLLINFTKHFERKIK